jgi:hypothetical protein
MPAMSALPTLGAWLGFMPFSDLVCACAGETTDNASATATAMDFIVSSPGRLMLAQSAKKKAGSRDPFAAG